MSESVKGASPRSPRYFDLEHLYEKARCLKDDVLWAWVDNLLPWAMSGPSEPLKCKALRRIGYIEDFLIGGYGPPPKLKGKLQSHY